MLQLIFKFCILSVSLLGLSAHGQVTDDRIEQIGAATAVAGAGLIAWGFYPGPAAITDHRKLVQIFSEIRNLEARIDTLKHSPQRHALARDIALLKQNQSELIAKLLLTRSEVQTLVTRLGTDSQESRHIEKHIIERQKNHRPHRSVKMVSGALFFIGGLILYFNAPTIAESLTAPGPSADLSENQRQVIVALIEQFLDAEALVAN